MNIFSAVDLGQKRKENQDYVFISDVPVGNLSNLFVVADGMGGHNAGAFASRSTVETLLEYIGKTKERNPVNIIRSAIRAANVALFQKAQEDTSLIGMGTTLVVATIVGNCLYVANIGDSRLYVVSEEIQQVTKDHSLVEEMIRIGELNREEARSHPDKNIITRAVGVNSDVEIDFFDFKLSKNDIVLLCSDGLSNMVKDNEIKEIIKTGSDLPTITSCLVGKANENGGKDNIAVILIEAEIEE
jgi:Serine/threonine protein phosphatase